MEEEMFGNPAAGQGDPMSEWLEKCTRAEEIAQRVRGKAEDPNEIVTVAMFVDSREDMVSTVKGRHSSWTLRARAIEQAKWAAANAPTFISHSHMLMARGPRLRLSRAADRRGSSDDAPVEIDTEMHAGNDGASGAEERADSSMEGGARGR
jgi:hypothetical protein